MRIDRFDGPRPLRDMAGRAVIRFGQFPDCPELAPDFTASVIGWGSQLVASCPDLEALAEAIERRFCGRVAVAVGETVNPRGWPVAVW
jgi:hypothetical protein